ncbi:hypothetical protein [Rosistilla oblonga]|uniref:hypothetical protein n=1 Tax=Rosistilla oblonga TaxID=2527990 RepID=UPI003A97B677
MGDRSGLQRDSKIALRLFVPLFCSDGAGNQRRSPLQRLRSLAFFVRYSGQGLVKLTHGAVVRRFADCGLVKQLVEFGQLAGVFLRRRFNLLRDRGAALHHLFTFPLRLGGSVQFGFNVFELSSHLFGSRRILPETDCTLAEKPAKLVCLPLEFFKRRFDFLEHSHGGTGLGSRQPHPVGQPAGVNDEFPSRGFRSHLFFSLQKFRSVVFFSRRNFSASFFYFLAVKNFQPGRSAVSFWWWRFFSLCIFSAPKK